MLQRGFAHWIILAAALLVGIAEIYALAIGQLPVSEGGLPFLLVALSASTLLFRRDFRVVAVLSLLLTSLSAASFLLLTSLSAAWVSSPESADWVRALIALMGNALLWLTPFLFTHFSLIFPVPNRWIELNPHRLALVYLPYVALLGPYLWVSNEQTSVWGQAFLLVIPAGFAFGISIFVYQYLFTLTGAEKNRLRVILIGCLAGLVPYVLSKLGAPSPNWERLASLLLPLFPLSLAFAVLRENFYEIGHIFQQVLVYSLVSAGTISVFFLSYVLLPSLFGQGPGSGWSTYLIPLLLALIVVYPFQRWAWTYIASHFYRTPRGRASRAPLPQFRTIEPNPYIVGNPVQSRDMFFGRKEEFHFISTKLQGQREGCVILLYGERRAGKTSILHQIVNGRLGSRFVPVFVDMQGMVVQSDAELLLAMAGIVADAIASSIQAGSRPSLKSIAGFLDYTGFMDSAIREIGDRQLVILIDEYELLQHKVNQGKISGEIIGYLNSLLERYPHELSLILTGSRSQGISPAWHSLLGKAVARKISFLGSQDAEDLICVPLQGRVLFHSEAIADLLRLTRGQPFFTQLLCQISVEVLNEHRASYVDRNIVNQVMARMQENPPPQLLYQWSSFSSSEKLLLAALAALLKTPASFASSDWVDRAIQSLPWECREGLDATRSRMLLEDLRMRDILDRDQIRYRFTMDLMRRWIQGEHNVWNVLNEIKQQAARPAGQ